MRIKAEKKLLSGLFPYILILFLCSLVRFLYWYHAPGVIISEDTYSYYQVGQNMLREHLFVDHYRAPVYSLFIAELVYISGAPNAKIMSGPFFEKIGYVIPVQMAVGIFGLLILFHTLKILKFSSLLSLLFTLFIGTNIIIFSWERLLLTESFATFVLIALFFLSVKIFQKPRFIFFTLFLFLSVFSVTLRPFNVGLPAVPLFVMMLYHRKLRIVIYAGLVLFLYAVFIHVYSSVNLARWGFYGISRSSDINMLGKILEYKLPVDAGKDEKYIYSLVVDYQSQERDPHPFRFLEHYNLLNDSDIPKLIPLKKFGYQVIWANLPLYLLKSTELLPGALMDVSEKLVIMPPNINLISLMFNLDLAIARFVQIVFFPIFIFSFISLFQFLKSRTVLHAVMISAALISLYQIIFSVFIGHAEYGRLILPAQPVMYLFSFYWLKRIMEWGNKILRKHLNLN